MCLLIKGMGEYVEVASDGMDVSTGNVFRTILL